MAMATRLPLRPALVAPLLRSAIAASGSTVVSRSSARHFATAGPSAAHHHQAYSTALKPSVKQREERGQMNVVGDEGKGAEGPHPQERTPTVPDELHGPWTMMNPIYTEQELDSVIVVGREPVTVSDKMAHGSVKFFRKCFDFFTGYKNHPIPSSVLAESPVSTESITKLRRQGLLLSDKAWLVRIILLESIAGVPGMVGGTLRHLRSLRLLRRDGGWIHTLLEEAENERMHLLTFMTIAQPTIFTRAMVLAAQGVFYNAFFLLYLISSKAAHRFVGALEEEAVRTYTHCIHDIERGLIPEWSHKPAPRIAVDYWRLPQSATLLDVVRAVRADEATHRFVNHSLSSLDPKHDFNPFALGEPSAEIRGTKAGFTREESAQFAKDAQRRMMEIAQQNGQQKAIDA